MALIVAPQYLPMLGGMERECALLASEFARRGWQPVVITEQLGLQVPRFERAAGVVIHRVPSSPTRSLVVQLLVAARMAWLILRYRRSTAFAIVRTATLPAVVMGLLKGLRIVGFPTLVTAETANDVPALAARPFFRLSRLLLSANDRLNGLTQANVDHLRGYGFPGRKITMIPNGVDTAPWSMVTAPERIERFLFLGRLDPEKGLFELLDAFSEVRGRHPQVSLTIAGSGPAIDELQDRCVELAIVDAVRFAGLVPYEELGRVFESHDCLVLPSYSEGMPLSVLEAAVYRRAMIITDVGDIRRLFGNRIRICPPRDAAALAAAMEAAFCDRFPTIDYEDVIAAMSIEAVARRLLEALGQSP